MHLTPKVSPIHSCLAWLRSPDAPLLVLAFTLPIVCILGGRMIAQYFIPIALWYITLHWRDLFPLKRFLLHPLTWLMGGSILWGWINTYWSIAPADSISTLLRVGSLVIAGLLMLYLLLQQEVALQEPAAFRRALISGMVIAFICALSAVCLKGGLPALINHYLSSGRVFSLFLLKQGNLVLALLLWPTVIALNLHGRSALGHLVLIVGIVILGFMPSSTAQVAILASTACYIGIRILGRKWGFIALQATLVVISLSFIILLPRLSVPAIQQQVPSLALSMVHRLYIWQFAIDQIHLKPVTGWGAKSAGKIPGASNHVAGYAKFANMPLHPHNNLLQSWLELGLIGLTFYIALTAYILARIQQTGERLPPSIQAGCYATLICALTGGFAGFGLWQSWWVNANMLTAVILLALVLPVLQTHKTAR